MKKQVLMVVIGSIFGLVQASLLPAGETGDGVAKEDSAKAAVNSSSALAPHPPAPSAAQSKPGATAALKDIQLSFKLDPRLTKGLYMGDRWVSPPAYTRVGEGMACIVETRAFGLNSRGQTVNISAHWTSADPDTVSISPAQGHEVKLSMKRAGETTVEIVAGGFSKKLSIKVVERPGTLQAEITQHPAARITRAEAGHGGEQATNESQPGAESKGS